LRANDIEAPIISNESAEFEIVRGAKGIFLLKFGATVKLVVWNNMAKVLR
jgi:hypothetical protein